MSKRNRNKKTERVEIPTVKTAQTQKPRESVPAVAEEPASQTSNEPRFQLNVAQPRPDSAVIQMTWCLNPALVRHFEKEEVRFPYILISTFFVKGDGRWEEYHRELVPLGQAGTQVQFNKPGSFKICASVVWWDDDKKNKEETERKLHKRVFEHNSQGSYYTSVTSGTEYAGNSNTLAPIKTIEHTEVQSTEVRDGFFAKEPSKRLAWMVNLWCEGLPDDECHFRERALWLLVKIPAMGVYIILQMAFRILLLLFGVVFGYRELRTKALLHPFDWNAESVFGGENNISTKSFWWLTDKTGKRRSLAVSCLIFPPFWVTILCLAVATAIKQDQDALVGLGYASGGLVTIMVIVTTLIVIVNSVWTRRMEPKAQEIARKKEREREQQVEEQKARREREKKEREQQELKKLLDKTLQPLTCEAGGPKSGLFSELPNKHRRQLVIQFWDTKAKVCKPYRRG